MGTTAGLSKPPLLNEYMTGRVRYRRHQLLTGEDFRRNGWKDLLVPQLEFSVWKRGRWVCEYRDATEEDLKKRGDTVV